MCRRKRQNHLPLADWARSWEWFPLWRLVEAAEWGGGSELADPLPWQLEAGGSASLV